MYTVEINEVVVNSNEELSEELAKAYVAWAKKKYEGKKIEKVELTFDGDEVDGDKIMAIRFLFIKSFFFIVISIVLICLC